ncbi:MAG: TonB-dependent receptor plug domain-containing protein [Bacteroidota bacterium]
MKKERKVWAMTLIAFWWLAPNQTNAQQDSLASRQLSEVVVTASKFAKSQLETGQVLSVITQEQLAQSAGKDLAQVLNQQTGLVVSGANSNPGKDKSVYLRGARNHYTLVLVDGVPLNDPSGISGGAYDLRMLALDQVERIEILKGSQSTLYGTDAIAGVINIITKSASSEKINGSVSGSYGSFNTWRAIASVSGRIHQWSYQAGYSRLQTDGLSEALDRDDTGAFDEDETMQEAYHAQVTWTPTDQLTVSPFIRLSNFDGAYDNGPFADSRDNTYVSDLLHAGIHLKQLTNKGSINAQYSLNETNRKYQASWGNSRFEGRFQQAELFWHHSLSKSLQALAGVSWQTYYMKDATASKENPSVTISSPYASMYFQRKGLRLETGGRFNHHSQFGSTGTYHFTPSYLLNQQLKIFANASTGFKAPSLYQLYGQFGGNPDLKPERSRHYEVGLDWLAPEVPISIRATAYQREIRDVIVYISGTNQNYDRQNDQGIEVEPSYQNARLQVSAFYAWVSGEVTTRVAGVETQYDNLIRIPEHSFGARAGYKLTPRMNVSGHFKFFGERNDTYFEPGQFTPTSIALDGFALLDLYVDYSFYNNQLTCYVDARNVLNQSYQEMAGYTTPGFNAYAGFRLKL